MPRRNGMGPIGQGPFTGRGLGYCVASYGRRNRRLRGVYSLDENDFLDQKEVLKEEKRLLEHRLNIINEKLNNI